MKRPWTPSVKTRHGPAWSADDEMALELLESKAPEMAEILIRLDNICAYPPENRDELIIKVFLLSNEAKELLKSVGWEGE
jgi:hypothetical protein